MQKLEYGKAICYSGYRAGQSPKTQVPSKEQIAEDMAILAKDGYRYIRMYDPNEHARRVLEVIRENQYPMQCIIGIDSDPESNNPNCPWAKQEYTKEELAAFAARNDAEVDKLIALVKEFDAEVFAVSVGNENTPDWGMHMVSEDRLIAHARKLKANLDKPVTFCEGYFEWPRLEKLAAELDFISLHTYPYHYGDAVEDSVAVNKKHYADTCALFPGKQVVITELGWSGDASEEERRGRASVEKQQYYVEAVEKWVEEDGVIAFIFEAFNELWKGDNPRASECNFGLYGEDRKKKW